MAETVTKDEFTEVKISLIKLEKDMDVMTSAMTKLAHTMETLAPVIIEMSYMRKEIDELKKVVSVVSEDQARDNLITKAALTIASLVAGAGITIILKFIFLGG